MSNKPLTTTPTLPTKSTAPDYEVPDSLKAWERFDRLVGKVLAPPNTLRESKASADSESDCVLQTPK